jgi:hypothetical protein
MGCRIVRFSRLHKLAKNGLSRLGQSRFEFLTRSAFVVTYPCGLQDEAHLL